MRKSRAGDERGFEFEAFRADAMADIVRCGQAPVAAAAGL